MKKIALISLALVLALGTLGVAGAMWWDDLFIDGYVETGNIGVEWSLDYWYADEWKDVSEMFVGIDGDTLYVDIYNAYPCVNYVVGWDLHGVGSVPVHFVEPIITTDLPAGATFIFVVYDATGLRIPWSDIQLHFCDYVYGELIIHLDNTVPQNAQYSFMIELIYHQYNEMF